MGATPAPAEAADEDGDARAMPAPVRPTPAMIEQHNVSHLPFRNWCPFCVRGRGKSCSHPRQAHDDEQLPTIAIDYGFLGSADEPAVGLPILVVKDRWSKAVWAFPVPAKGVEHPPRSPQARGCPG